jgi:hypothetical protein
MHSYKQRWSDDRADEPLATPADFTFRDALDVAGYAEIDPLTTWYTWPDVWHLDHEGQWQCCSRGCTLDSVRTFARAPAEMLACRLSPVDPPCPDNWVIVEPRQRWRFERPEVNEDDARAFAKLRVGLARFGVTLLDVVVFDGDFHWWSLHELTSGATAWTFAPVQPTPRRRSAERARG